MTGTPHTHCFVDCANGTRTETEDSTVLYRTYPVPVASLLHKSYNTGIQVPYNRQYVVQNNAPTSGTGSVYIKKY